MCVYIGSSQQWFTLHKPQSKDSTEMEGKNLLRYLFFLSAIVLLLFFTLLNLPSPPSKAELLDCTTSSLWCTSKNRIQSKNPITKPNSHTADVPHHPLDPLTLTEFNRIKKIIQSYQLFKNSVYALHSVVLEEPEKKAVLNWKKGDPLPARKASVIARASSVSHVLTVDLSTGEVTRVEKNQYSGYPTMTLEDMSSVTWAPLASADFNRTVIERGVDLIDLACLPISTGWFGMKIITNFLFFIFYNLIYICIDR